MQGLEEIWLEIYESLLDLDPNFPDVLIIDDPTVRTKPRHFAAALVSGPEGREKVELFLHPDLYNEPEERIRGVLAHEAGHFLSDLGYISIEEQDDERHADAAAEMVFGIEIHYDDDLVQMVGPAVHGTRPRPAQLR